VLRSACSTEPRFRVEKNRVEPTLRPTGFYLRKAQPSRFREAAVDEDRGLSTCHLPKSFKLYLKVLGR